jgi:Zn-finger nucleic acid-binding protein
MTYRDTTLACPGCGEALDPKNVGDAVIDVCPACGGIWVDWFDGELVEMVRGAPPASSAPLSERGGRHECPRCQRPLASERYLESNAEILRCADCAGAYVPRGSAQAVARYDPESPPPAGALHRLAVLIERWLGWEREQDPG